MADIRRFCFFLIIFIFAEKGLLHLLSLLAFLVFLNDVGEKNPLGIEKKKKQPVYYILKTHVSPHVLQ